MTNSNQLAEASDQARNALDLMERHQIPATPKNFAVWHAYLDGDNLNLVNAIDSMLASDAPFSPEQNTEFFNKFCNGNVENELKEMGQRIESAVAQVSAFMGIAVTGASQYGSSLEAFTGKLAEPQTPAGLSNLVTDIISATRTMIEVNNQLSHRLTTSVKEVAQLKKNLETLKRESTVDHLTKLFNRKWFDQVLDQSKLESDSKSTPLSLMMIDIDFFKKFNDTYGHQLGDQVLKLVARTITDCVGETDTAARYGGEEFSVILPDCSLTQAMEKAELIRKTVAGRKVTNRNTGKVLGQVTLSVGVAQYTNGEPAPDLIHRADQSLYFAKNNGRNRVCTETDLG